MYEANLKQYNWTQNPVYVHAEFQHHSSTKGSESIEFNILIVLRPLSFYCYNIIVLNYHGMNLKWFDFQIVRYFYKLLPYLTCRL